MSPNRRFVLVLASLVGAVTALLWLGQLYTEWLWFRHDAYPVVFERRLLARLVLFAVTALLVYGLLAGNLALVRRRAPVARAVDDSDLDPELRAWLDGLLTPLLRWLPPVLAVVAGFGASTSWQPWLLAIWGEPFGVTDPQFGLDVGFWVYRLGVFSQALRSLSSLLLVTLLAVIALLAYVDQIHLREGEISFSRQARGHILSLVAALLVVRAGAQWLSRYTLLITPTRLFCGAGWTDVNIRLPALTLSAVLALAAALVCLWVARSRRPARLAYIALGLHVAVSLLGVGLVPAILARVKVAPNEIDVEAPYIERAITATRRAYGLDEARLTERNFPAAGQLTAADLRRNRETLEDIRVWDHRPALRTFSQLQEIRQYYDIIDIDSDRYLIDGRRQQVLVAARELNAAQLDAKAKSWVNQHLEYTHGFGLVVSSVKHGGGEGQPDWLVSDIPPKSSVGLTIDQPRLYFGEQILLPPEPIPQANAFLPQQQQQQQTVRPEQLAERQRERLNAGLESDESDYLLVGARDEFDYAETRGEKEIKHRTRYAGQSGIPVGGFFRRLAFALRLRSLELAVSGLVTPDTKLLLRRQVTRRCKAAAPFLRWDVDPYPILADGRVKWICEAYTATLSYPYAEIYHRRIETPKGPRWQRYWNYLRNPVKAVVDAYDGTVSLYVIDPEEPLCRSWQRIFPGMFRPASEASAEVREHFRYPVRLFESQADIYRRYHMTDPRTFYQQEDLWAVAQEVDREAERQQATPAPGPRPRAESVFRPMAPYYITLSLPGEQRTEFMLICSFTPFASRGERNGSHQPDNLIAWMGALCDPERYGQLVVYKFPKDTNIYGPLQVEARINQNDAISQQITLWDKGGSQVIRGNLLVIPIESSLLYVQPLYLESEQRGLPELKRVIVVHGDQVVMEPTIDAALRRLFGAWDTGAAPRPSADRTPPTGLAPAPPAGQAVDPGLLETARRAYDAAEDALRRGDWATYQSEQAKLGETLRALAAAGPPAGP